MSLTVACLPRPVLYTEPGTSSEEVTQAVRMQYECLECGSTEPKEDNHLLEHHFDYALL